MSSLYRDSDKLHKTGNEHLLDRLNTEIRNLRSRETDTQRKYNRLYCAVMDKYGMAEARKLNKED